MKKLLCVVTVAAFGVAPNLFAGGSCCSSEQKTSTDSTKASCPYMTAQQTSAKSCCAAKMAKASKGRTAWKTPRLDVKGATLLASR